jgi:hypothetical protein
MLYRPEAFEPLTDEGWNEGRVREAIRTIVAETDDALRGPRLLWRAHAWDRWQATSPMKNLYVGAAGVVWALDRLRARGHADTRLDLAEIAARTLDLFRRRPDFQKVMRPPDPAESALLTGETGILVVAWRLAPSDELADAVLARVRANVGNESDDVMWGTPGTLLAAQAMVEMRGEDVEIVGGPDDDTRAAGAPLQANLSVGRRERRSSRSSSSPAPSFPGAPGRRRSRKARASATEPLATATRS